MAEMEMHYGTTPGTGDLATCMREEAGCEKEILQMIVDNIPVMIGFYDRRGRVELINRELESVLGWSLEEWQSRDLLAECYPDPQYRQEVIDYMLAPALEWHDFKTGTRDGRNIDTRWLNIKLSDGRSIGIGENITDRKQLERELRQSQKMEAVGLLAAGVAHELNNPLGAIVGYADILLERDNLDGPSKEFVIRIVKRAEQAAKVVSQLKGFAQPSEMRKHKVDLSRVIEDSIEMVTHQMSLQGVRVATHLHPQTLSVWADRDCLEQVFLNLALNAKDSMPAGGELTITTRLDEVGRSMEVTFADTGMGIPESNLGKIFDPFFTWGKNGQGTGLGLSISQRIVQDHGGHIKVESEEGRGTTFTVVLPRCEGT